jgi:hypothetical protein
MATESQTQQVHRRLAATRRGALPPTHKCYEFNQPQFYQFVSLAKAVALAAVDGDNRRFVLAAKISVSRR